MPLSTDDIPQLDLRLPDDEAKEAELWAEAAPPSTLGPPPTSLRTHRPEGAQGGEGRAMVNTVLVNRPNSPRAPGP
jgi:hypothetical protein